MIKARKNTSVLCTLIFSMIVFTLTPAFAIPMGEKIEVSVEARDGEVVFHWIDPEGDFDRMKIVGAGQTQYIEKGVQTTTVRGLTNGVSYTFRLYAVSGGILFHETEVLATPVDNHAPSPVTGACAKAFDNYILVQWVDPSEPDLDRIMVTSGDQVIYVDVRVGQLIVEEADPNGFQIVAIDTSNNNSEAVWVDIVPVREAKILIEGAKTV